MQYPIATDSAARQRIDKWLWAARFFKTRSLASHALGLGRVQVNGEIAKPSREVRVGDQVCVQIEHVDWELEVLGLCEMRGPASVAQTLYRETEASRAARAAEQARRQWFKEPAANLHGRPTKRDRRALGKLGRS
jgi:ribosome-associated heat shock protein Hsp15